MRARFGSSTKAGTLFPKTGNDRLRTEVQVSLQFGLGFLIGQLAMHNGEVFRSRRGVSSRCPHTPIMLLCL